MSDIWIHEDSVTVALPVPTNGTSIPCSQETVIVKQYEITDECIERIADAVVRKLMEVEHEVD